MRYIYIMSKYVFIALSILIIYRNSPAGVLLNISFDDISDWQSTETTSTTEDWASTYNKTPAEIPSPFTSYRASVTPTPTSGTITKQQHEISSDISYSGKAYQAWYYNNSSFWQHGCISAHLDSTGYSELYIQFKVKYDANWKWRPYDENTIVGGSPQAIFQKIFRVIYNVDLNNLTGDPQDTDDYTRYVIVDWWGWGTGYESSYPRLMLTARGDADFSDADDVTTYTSALWYSIFTDLSKWYTLEFHFKMNNYPTADGVFEFWVNGIKLAISTDISYIDEEVITGAKMSFIMLADNIFNSWAAGPTEQSMSIDNIIVSTDYIGDNLAKTRGCSITGGSLK